MSLYTVVSAAAIAGVLSLPHCAVMCGPLALAGCGGKRPFKAALAYLAARIVGYSAVGALLGAVGHHWLNQGVFSSAQLAALVGLLVWCGYRAVVAATRYWLPQRRFATSDLVQLRAPAAAHSNGGSTATATLKQLLAPFIPKSALALGLVTAVLPCGALVGAWLLAAATADPLYGSASMLVFAAASSPALLGAVLGQTLWRRIGGRMSPLVAALGWLALAALLLGRFWANQAAIPCH